ncbi:uncharacterized protein [Nicotiana tomentosiformis]|uniref:uncharacterized protein n=1 Tax=Nicotiana tomentosiformis TaxID=4098 RepID=UPI000878B674
MAFMKDEKILLRVSPIKEVMRIWKKGKLSPRFIDPFKVLERAGKVALPPNLLGVHPVFYGFMLQKYHEHKLHIFDFSTMQLDENLAYEEELVDIFDRQVQKLRSKVIA